ncbi:DUF4834 family protein [Parapedobacter tibetensis]|uniref:DUF4834 family protein n=1 Tax=Parapedobacter tibetensis TaxID=2972951 RepID=UPI00214DB9D0|nr:DUF4834 family protein [Parapedobacter tibetensis]
MGLLKFLLIAVAILWLVRVVARLIFPWAMRKMAEKVMGNAQQQYQHQHNNRTQQTKPDGKVRIDYMPPQSKPKNGAKKAGEFVEFEEIKSSAK